MLLPFAPKPKGFFGTLGEAVGEALPQAGMLALRGKLSADEAERNYQRQMELGRVEAERAARESQLGHERGVEMLERTTGKQALLGALGSQDALSARLAEMQQAGYQRGQEGKQKLADYDAMLALQAKYAPRGRGGSPLFKRGMALIKQGNESAGTPAGEQLHKAGVALLRKAGVPAEELGALRGIPTKPVLESETKLGLRAATAAEEAGTRQVEVHRRMAAESARETAAMARTTAIEERRLKSEITKLRRDKAKVPSLSGLNASDKRMMTGDYDSMIQEREAALRAVRQPARADGGGPSQDPLGLGL